jgi:hypothetical protein
MYKKIIGLFLFSIMLFGQMIPVQAASFSVKANKSTISPNSSFTVSISTQGAGQFSVSASNGKVSSSSVWVDGSSSVSITGGSSGTTSVTVTAVDATGYDETPITGSHTVSVKIKTPSSGSNSSSSHSSSHSTSGSSSSSTVTKKEPEVKKSSENNLSSLSISTGKLSPAFSSDKTSYQVDLTSDVEDITITAKAKDSKAKVSGTGKKELHIGENIFKVTVTAENGSIKRYTLSVIVTEKPTQFLTYDNQKLGILNDLSKTDVSKGFDKTTIKIDNKDVTALQNKDMGLTLLYLQNEKEETGFYIYDTKKNKVLSPFETITVNGKIYIIVSPDNIPDSINNLAKTTIKIGDKQVNGWKFNEKELSSYSIVYLMNEDGQKNYYSYDKEEGTLQRYTIIDDNTSNNLTAYILAGTTGGFFITTIIFSALYYTFKKKSIASVKAYYESKNY